MPVLENPIPHTCKASTLACPALFCTQTNSQQPLENFVRAKCASQKCPIQMNRARGFLCLLEQLLIRRGAIYMVDDEDIDRGLAGFELQTKLFAKGRED